MWAPTLKLRVLSSQRSAMKSSKAWACLLAGPRVENSVQVFMAPWNATGSEDGGKDQAGLQASKSSVVSGL